jgi:hypothetical protein
MCPVRMPLAEFGSAQDHPQVLVAPPGDRYSNIAHTVRCAIFDISQTPKVSVRLRTVNYVKIDKVTF